MFEDCLSFAQSEWNPVLKLILQGVDNRNAKLMQNQPVGWCENYVSTVVIWVNIGDPSEQNGTNQINE